MKICESDFVALQGIANDAKKARTQSAPAEEKNEKQGLSYRDSEVTGFVPQQRTFGAKINNDPKHGSIIRNIASQSSTNQQTSGNTTWTECRHLKKSDFGKDYCTEYHSLCAKENCRRAKK